MYIDMSACKNKDSCMHARAPSTRQKYILATCRTPGVDFRNLHDDAKSASIHKRHVYSCYLATNIKLVSLKKRLVSNDLFCPDIKHTSVQKVS